MIHSRAPRIHVHLHHQGIPWTSILLGLMAMLVVAMPVSYRAGTEASHPHTVFQAMIDHATGHTHHHPGEDKPHTHATTSTALSPFASPAIPLNVLSAPTHDHATTAMQPEPDVPTITNAKPSLDQPLIIASIAGLLILAATVVVRRAAWPRPPWPEALAVAPDIPPPRPLSIRTAF